MLISYLLNVKQLTFGSHTTLQQILGMVDHSSPHRKCGIVIITFMDMSKSRGYTVVYSPKINLLILDTNTSCNLNLNASTGNPSFVGTYSITQCSPVYASFSIKQNFRQTKYIVTDTDSCYKTFRINVIKQYLFCSYFVICHPQLNGCNCLV